MKGSTGFLSLCSFQAGLRRDKPCGGLFRERAFFRGAKDDYGFHARKNILAKNRTLAAALPHRNRSISPPMQ